MAQRLPRTPTPTHKLKTLALAGLGLSLLTTLASPTALAQPRQTSSRRPTPSSPQSPASQSPTVKSPAQLPNLANSAPTRRIGGGSRNSCSLGPQTIAAIAPKSNLIVTSATQPSLLFYLGEANANREVEFVLRDSRDQPIYSKLLTLPAQAGLVTLDLASLDDTPRLALNQDHRWYLSIVCDPRDRAKDIVIEGDLRRVALTPWLAAQGSPLTADQLQASAPLARALAYRQSALWQDAMVELSQLQQSAPSPDLRQGARQQWQALLQADPELATLASTRIQPLIPLAISDIPEDDFSLALEP